MDSPVTVGVRTLFDLCVFPLFASCSYFLKNCLNIPQCHHYSFTRIVSRVSFWLRKVFGESEYRSVALFLFCFVTVNAKVPVGNFDT